MMVMIIITCKNLNDHLLIVPRPVVGIAGSEKKFIVGRSRRLGPKPHDSFKTHLH